MDIAVIDDVPPQSDDHSHLTRAGTIVRKWLLTGEAEDGLRYRLFQSVYQEGEAAFESPRHHHAFQQVRWTQQGSINYAPGEDIPEGSLAYFPRGTFYGPQRKDKGIGFLLQFGFDGELHSSKFEIEMDASRLGQPAPLDVLRMSKPKADIPAERYQTPILMHPEAFDAHPAAPGAQFRQLGSFFDQPGLSGDIRLSTVSFSDDGEHPLSPDRAQIGWSTSPGLRIEGKSYPALTSFFSPRGETAAISGRDGVEVVLIDFPRRD